MCKNLKSTTEVTPLVILTKEGWLNTEHIACYLTNTDIEESVVLKDISSCGRQISGAPRLSDENNWDDMESGDRTSFLYRSLDASVSFIVMQ